MKKEPIIPLKEKLISFETAKLAKEKRFSTFNNKTKSAIVDTRNNDIQRFSFYVDTTNQDFSKLYDDVIERTISLKENIGTNSSQICGLISYYEGKISVNIHYYLAPTQSLLQKWLREIHELDVYVISEDNGTYWYNLHGENINPRDYRLKFGEDDLYNSTYEEALEIGLLAALKLIDP